jgi:NAD(P)H dehydrogenase (quinone)
MSKNPTVYVIYYSTYGHVKRLAKEIIKGLQKSGVNAKLFQVAETLPQEVLSKMFAAPHDDSVPIITAELLAEADGKFRNLINGW